MRWIPRDPHAQLALAAAAGALFMFVAFRARGADSVVIDPPEPLTDPPRPPEPNKRLEWLALEGEHVTLYPGIRYRGCVRLPWYLSRGMVRGKLRAGLEEKGFRDIAIAESSPAGWSVTECDFFVEATWGREATELDVPSAVAFAWWGRWS